MCNYTTTSAQVGVHYQSHRKKRVSYKSNITLQAAHCQPYTPTVLEVYTSDTITSHQVLCSFSGFMHAN